MSGELLQDGTTALDIPWIAFPPRALGITCFEVLTEFVEPTLTALTRINRASWDTATTDQPTWMRAKHAVNIMTDVGIDPVLQNVDGLMRLLMVTQGPKEGAYVGSVLGASQVRRALRNRPVA